MVMPRAPFSRPPCGALSFPNQESAPQAGRLNGVLRVLVVLGAVLQLVAGCAARSPARAARNGAPPAVTRPVPPPPPPSIATLPLNQILPVAELPRPRATTAPSTAPTTSPAEADRPPIDA